MKLLGFSKKTMRKIILLLRPKRFLRWRVSPSRSSDNFSARRINTLLRISNVPSRYLEIGVYAGKTLEAVDASIRVGVDPFPRFSPRILPKNTEFHRSTSAGFFERYNSAPFDVIFLDGLHESSETLRDFVWSLRFLNPGGYIVIDDVLPTDEPSSHPDELFSRRLKKKEGIQHSRWYGDVWRVLEIIRQRGEGLDVTLVGDGDDEHCQAVVRKLRESSTIPGDLADLTREMSLLDFHETVDGDSGLRSIALSERIAIDKIVRSGKLAD